MTDDCWGLGVATGSLSSINGRWLVKPQVNGAYTLDRHISGETCFYRADGVLGPGATGQTYFYGSACIGFPGPFPPTAPLFNYDAFSIVLDFTGSSFTVEYILFEFGDPEEGFIVFQATLSGCSGTFSNEACENSFCDGTAMIGNPLP